MARRPLCAMVAVAIRQAYRAYIIERLVDAGVEPDRAVRAARRLVRDRHLTLPEALS